jgi:hypothetical protein
MCRLGLGEVALDVSLEIVEGQTLAKVVARATEFGEATTDGSRELRHPLWSEDQQRDDHNQHELHRTDTKHKSTI